MKTFRPYVFLVLAIVVFMTLFFIHRNENMFTVENPTSMSEAWTYDGQAITMPTKLDIPVDEPYTIQTTLSDEFNLQTFVFVRSSLQNITIELDGVILYQQVYGQSLDRPYASMWHSILIPNDSEGSVLEITLSSPYPRMSGELNDITYGTEIMQYAYIARTYGVRLFIAATVFLIGFIVMVADLFFSKKQERGYAYMGLFAILLSLWMFAESRTIQFFTGSPLIIGSLAYLTLPLFGIPMITFLYKYVLQRYKKPILVIQMLLILQFSLVVLLYVFNVAHFFQTLFMTQILIGAAIITIITSLLLEAYKLDNQKAKQFIKAFGVLIVFGIAELFNFIFGNYTDLSVFVLIGVALLMIVLLVTYIKYVIERIKLSHEKELFEKLAYIDHITQGNNRLAFERDINKVFEKGHHDERVRLILFDLDDLKGINDTYGHAEGDQAIKTAFEIITDTFSDNGLCYRIGGDEFACLYYNNDESVYEEKKKTIARKTKKIAEQTNYKLTLSYGSALAKPADIKAKELVHLADTDMYHNKKRKKGL